MISHPARLLAAGLVGGLACAQSGAPLDWRLLPLPVADHHAMVFDTVRQRFVMQTDRTWEWDGVDWRERRTDHRPRALTAFGMVFDEVRGRTVLFGGLIDNAHVLGEVWEYDGVDWVQRSFAGGPSARWSPAMTWDPLRRRAVVFGGLGPPGISLFADTWNWDGNTWTQIVGAGPPPTLGTATMAFHAPTARSVLLCATTNGSSTETWTFDGAAWQQQQPATIPTAQSDGYRAWADNAAGVVRAAGGNSSTVWEWNGSDWTATSSPLPARSHSAMACDPAGTSLLVGGKAMGVLLATSGMPVLPIGDTWRLQSGSWTMLHDTGPMDDVALAADLVHGTVLATDLTTLGRRTFVFAQGEWHRDVNAQLPALFGARMCFDFARSRLVLFGGGGDHGVFSPASATPTNSLFEYDGQQWIRINVGGPTPRSKHAMVYDIPRNRVLLFGGNDGVNSLGDTWTWNGMQWQSIATTGPSPRHGAAMAPDLLHGKVVLFGGLDMSLLGDTWLWDGVTWTMAAPVRLPAARFDAGFDYDYARQRPVLAGGKNALTSTITDQWEWDGVDWSPTSTSIPETLNFVWPSALASQGTGVGMLRVANGRTWLGAVTTASVAATGSGCGSVVPVLIAMGEPALGRSTFAFELHRVAANAPFALGLGGSPASIPLGGGCTLLLASIDLVSIGTATAAGNGVAVVPVPNSPALRGLVAVAQGAALDSTAPLGFVLTNGLTARAGD